MAAYSDDFFEEKNTNLNILKYLFYLISFLLTTDQFFFPHKKSVKQETITSSFSVWRFYKHMFIIG